MTTLADLTEEQRKACVGMWADYSATLVVITYVYWYEYSQGFFVDVLHPAEGYEETEVHVSCITPRPDLPRAWNPDGTPVSDHIAALEEIADEYRNHCLANGDDNTIAWIDSKRGELDDD